MFRSPFCFAPLVLLGSQAWCYQAGDSGARLHFEALIELEREPQLPTRLEAQPQAHGVSLIHESGERLRIEEWSLPGGEALDLDLERVDLERMNFGLRVDGQPRQDLLEDLELSVWRGRVHGEPGSSLMLSFSHAGVRGWIRRGEQMIHLVPGPSEEASWAEPSLTMIFERELASYGLRAQLECGSLRPEAADRAEVPGAETATEGACGLLECSVAVETDYQLFALYDDLPALTAYVTTLLASVSDRYTEQIDTVLTFPYLQFYTDPADPWLTGDIGGDAQDMLYEFQSAWIGNIPAGARLAHFLSGADLGGGWAFIDVLCDPFHAFAVSGSLGGTVSFPIQQQPINWDFIVIAHEFGHNFGTVHTHDYCPPLDECAPLQNFGPCQTQELCIADGTIMSYCQLCPGGNANHTSFFHPTVAQVMRDRAASCLPGHTGIVGSRPTVLVPGSPAVLEAEVSGNVHWGPMVFWRMDSGPPEVLFMTAIDSCNYEAALQVPDCGGVLEFAYLFFVSSSEVARSPSDPNEYYRAWVPSPSSTLQVDDFESDLGWFATNLGATTGDWERGIPIDDSTWPYGPASDYDGSGQCWLTMNQPGNTDVDNGQVRLTSPPFDLSDSDSMVSYAYFLHQSGAKDDMLLVEATTQGLAGPWYEVVRHTTNTGLQWNRHELRWDDFVQGGVIPSADTRLRFTASDEGTPTIVEAGLDDFRVERLLCGPLGIRYCPGLPASNGATADLLMSGSPSVARNQLTLQAGPVPVSSNSGIFFYGSQALSLPLGDGLRCVGGTVGRLPVASNQLGDFEATLDLTQAPSGAVQILPGSTWYFQVWYDDLVSTGAGFNLSSARQVTFAP